VDLAQAANGLGMAVFSRYNKVLESDAAQMQVRTVLALINQSLDEVLSEQEIDFDPNTRWALAYATHSSIRIRHGSYLLKS
jgi:putative DNA methylase